MAYPPDLSTSVFTDGPTVTSNDWYTRIFSWFNSLRDAINPLTSTWRAVGVATSSIPSAAWATNVLDTLLVDTDGVGISAGGGWKCPATGTYLLSGVASVPGPNAATGSRRIGSLNVNGIVGGAEPAGLRQGISHTAIATQYSIPLGPSLALITAGWEVLVSSWQDGGTTLPTFGGLSSLSVRRLA